MKRTLGERTFDTLNITLMVLLSLGTLYPFINTLAISFSDGLDAQKGGIYLWPRQFSVSSYQVVFSDKTIIGAYWITLSRTALGMLVTVFCTGLLAYGLSKQGLMGRRAYLLICVFSMIFYGGLIPTYLLYKEMGLLSNFLVYIIPGAINVWYMILMKTFFEQLPKELEESAIIDGCGYFSTFYRIIIPVSMPIVATICIFVGVDHWNSWFDAYIFNNNPKLQPIQTFLYKIIALSQTPVTNAAQSQLMDRLKANQMTIKAASVVITAVPISLIYFLFQKHFTKGLMVGAIKG
ncbi:MULTISPECIES: carbohydrate ABC transporter permease [Paenibacillus]|uniref:carbohydrate ABC transporter permease n=1 Tax=Paenibacillus TaxID=44249 RepID=UPI0022B90026|nr:carbohydrate ABC transporter permease [Paenibacillus caseinilyticus]MCZ8518446.1 carbohydrate ABC transporter permease [Paenibacillus caseinilyticus]